MAVEEENVIETPMDSTTCENNATTATATITPLLEPEYTERNTKFTDKDVLFGRGQFYYKHPGNLSFRRLVASSFPVYQSSKSKKDEVSKILRTLRQSQFQFWKQDPSNKNAWKNIADDDVSEKIRQYLSHTMKLTSSSVLVPSTPITKPVRKRASETSQATVVTRKRKAASSSSHVPTTKESKKSSSNSTEKNSKTKPSTPKSTKRSSKTESSVDQAETKKNGDVDRKEDDNTLAEFSSANETFMTDEGVGIHNLATTDILCGKGGLVKNHSGNKRFREILDSNRDEYASMLKKEKKQKLKAILETLKKEKIRFLKRENAKSDDWQVVDDDTLALSKIQQYLCHSPDKKQTEKTLRTGTMETRATRNNKSALNTRSPKNTSPKSSRVSRSKSAAQKKSAREEKPVALLNLKDPETMDNNAVAVTDDAVEAILELPKVPVHRKKRRKIIQANAIELADQDTTTAKLTSTTPVHGVEADQQESSNIDDCKPSSLVVIANADELVEGTEVDPITAGLRTPETNVNEESEEQSTGLFSIFSILRRGKKMVSL